MTTELYSLLFIIFCWPELYR